MTRQKFKEALGDAAFEAWDEAVDRAIATARPGRTPVVDPEIVVDDVVRRMLPFVRSAARRAIDF